MSSLVFVGLGFCLLAFESSLAMLVPLTGFAPNFMLPFAMFLGVSAEVHILRGALTSFVLGYLLDSFCGAPMGLQTFVLTASFLLSRGAGVRLLSQSRFVQVSVGFVMSIAFGGTVLALRAIFEQPVGVTFDRGAGQTAATLLYSAVTTGMLCPLIFAGLGRIEAMGTFRRERRTLSH